MNHRYEALLVLNAQGKEDSVREIIDRLESDFQKEGAQIEQVQKMDKRQFAYAAGPLDSGYYVNFIVRRTSASETRKRSRGKRWQRPNNFSKTGAWPVSTKSFCLEISPATRKCVTHLRAAPSATLALR